ncbi:MAG TPA: hypothetical protein VIT67_15725 [Povalibacter sp.]
MRALIALCAAAVLIGTAGCGKKEDTTMAPVDQQPAPAAPETPPTDTPPAAPTDMPPAEQTPPPTDTPPPSDTTATPPTP